VPDGTPAIESWRQHRFRQGVGMAASQRCADCGFLSNHPKGLGIAIRGNVIVTVAGADIASASPSMTHTKLFDVQWSRL